MTKQSEIIKQLTDQELKIQVLLTQFFLLLLSIVLSFLLFENVTDWFLYFDWDLHTIFYYGVLPGLLIVLIDLILMGVFPKRYYDDGGINERVFKNRSFVEIFYITLFVAISEELLFRGVIQTTVGYFVASTIFALIHFRYLKKIVLLISVLLVSFYIGYLFELTESLTVTITAHFIIDFLLAMVIRLKK
ncbi:CPBP family intramembrane glutamic endopeptidase [Oceanobacillus halotolerans]|uniref:CPBP family intramembrane glutamic endopeptidase n=1 Tax=Oceanobacillus halotolerans TaxID=2663380 RepID=UPI0013DAE16E|nr:CPBP family intramembrane glutamic endopeptidase [Oceanobacillus halotolerans]